MKQIPILLLLTAASIATGEQADDVLKPLVPRAVNPLHAITLSEDLVSAATISNVVEEINAAATREVLAKSMSLATDQAMLPQFVITNMSLHCFRNGADPAAYNAVKFRMYWYAASRLDGHTIPYAQTNLIERGRNIFREGKSPREQILRHHQDCPPSWLRSGPEESEHHVTDGDTVWVYHRVVGRGWPSLDYFTIKATKRDPAELKPDFPALLERTGVQARANLTKRGVEKQIGYCHRVWQEMAEILRREHGIRWRSPAEQDLDTIYD